MAVQIIRVDLPDGGCRFDIQGDPEDVKEVEDQLDSIKDHHGLKSRTEAFVFAIKYTYDEVFGSK